MKFIFLEVVIGDWVFAGLLLCAKCYAVKFNPHNSLRGYDYPHFTNEDKMCVSNQP